MQPNGQWRLPAIDYLTAEFGDGGTLVVGQAWDLDESP